MKNAFRDTLIRLSVAVLAACGGMAAAVAQDQPTAGATAPMASEANEGYRFPLKGLPDLVLPSMNPAKGRVYFATRACVVCHSVNGIGGKNAVALDIEIRPATVDMLGFITRMWRGGTPMLALQRRLFSEQIDLTAEELGDIIAFLHSPAEQDRFSKNDIPTFIQEFMAKREQEQGR
ncbi:MAG: cytochrome c [Alphaproteobacteria bacterium]|nr:cytochrome c [Alphaproteobacteria bacterium]